MGIPIESLPKHVRDRLALDGAIDGEPAKRGNKFGAKRSDCAHGHRHDSKAEARRCGELVLLERAGRIRNLVQQPRFHFVVEGRQVVDDRGRALRFTADFGFDEVCGDGWAAVVEDVKSVATMTEAATLRMAFFRATHPQIKLRIVQ